MNPKVSLLGCVVLLIAANAAMATSFVVPTDDELVAKSQAIVIGTVEGSYVQEVDNLIETVAELRVERAVKGSAPANALISVVSPGGVMEDGRGVHVPASARFRQGERVLLFLTRHKERWTATDMTLGKFRFVTSTAGERLLVRDMEDVVGWDHAGRVHREKVRREEGFLRFVEERARGRRAEANYEVEASEVTIAPERNGQISTNAAPFPGATYTDFVNNQPIRWPNMSAGVPFWKRSDQNIAGASDGGVAGIQNGLAAWNNECASLINLTYAGQRATASAHHDGVNVVEYNDPQGRVAGSWGGTGTVGITFISFAGEHSFAGATWLNISDADVVFQDGYPATNASFLSAMIHELGHGIGFRHSNQSHLDGQACNPSVEECTQQAIMNSSVSANYGALQPWDVHAAESVYPGGSCGPACIPPVINSHPTSRTITSGQSTTLSVSASGTTPLSFQWYAGTSGSGSPIPGAIGSTLTVAPTTTSSYWVRVSNSCGTANSSTATVTVTGGGTPGRRVDGDYNGDGRTDVTIYRPSTGVWYSNGGFNPISWGISTDRPVPADYDGDGRTDIAVWRPSNGLWIIRHSSTGGQVQITWGQNGDVPVPADYDNDGRADVTVFRPSTGYWYSNGGFGVMQWGANGDIPVPADYDGDGDADVAVFRPSTGYWYPTAGPVGPIQWGANGDIPVPVDYNGDRRADITVWRPSNGFWYSNGGFNPIQWGQAGDVPVPGDYNGDGRYEVAVWRPSNGTWYITTTGSVVWGQNGDIPAIRHKYP